MTPKQISSLVTTVGLYHDDLHDSDQQLSKTKAFWDSDFIKKYMK